jgi:hypothetical protein
MTLSKISRRRLDLADGILSTDFPSSGPELVAIRQLLRATPDILDYGGVSGGTANHEAINAAMADNVNELYFPPGNWGFGAQPNAITRPVNIYGAGESLSVITMHYNGYGLQFTGATATGGTLADLTIWNQSGGSATAAFGLIAGAGEAPNAFRAQNLNITSDGSSTFQYGFLVDGEAKTTGAIGVRSLRLENIKTFNTTARGFELRHVRVALINGVQCYVGSGSDNSVLIGITNGLECDTILINELLCGNLTVTEANVVIADAINVQVLTLSAASTNCRMSGFASSKVDSGTGNNIANVT